jgi:hypothetical protein
MTRPEAKLDRFRRRRRLLVRAAAAALAASAELAQAMPPPVSLEPPEALEQRFRLPSDSARPRVWWHWIDGNVSRQGITRDLEWMKRIGIGGFQLFDVSRGYPDLVGGQASFMSPEWLDDVRFAAAEADRLGLEMSIAAGGGWSETGGPSVKPEQAMKKLVWSETRVHGGSRFQGALPAPPSINGPFQDLPVRPDLQFKGEPKMLPVHPKASYYADSRVIAFRLPDVAAATPATPLASASAGTPNAAVLRDGRFDRAFVLPSAGPEQDSWIQFDFGSAVTIRSLRLGIAWPEQNASPMPKGSVQASDDGVTFRPIAQLPEPATAANLPLYTLALPETSARYFRLVVRPGSGALLPGVTREVSEFRFTEVDFSAVPRPDRFEAKAGFSLLPDYEAVNTPTIDPALAVDRASVTDITDHLDRDGRLDWTPPEGEWLVLRFGYSLTGQINRPATAAATGFEVDKLSAPEVRNYLDHYFGPIFGSLGELSGRRGLRNVLTDSWEAGVANWTPTLLDEFKARRGYDPTPYLPVLAGYVVASAEASDRFLWDFRRTLADLLADSHYQVIGNFAREHGLGYWGEAMGIGLPTIGDGLQDKRYTSVPMAEFWQVDPSLPSDPKQVADVREAVSAAHVYGQNIVATESFTSFPWGKLPPPYGTSPRLLKPLADRFMAQGVNRFSIHAAVHQPLEQGPGFSLSFFGQYFSRLETWGELAGGWISYLTRASQMLQEGRAAEDIACFYGEGAPVTVPDDAVCDPQMPAGYPYDFVSRDMLLKDLRAGENGMQTASGLSYKVLVLPPTTTRLTPPLLRRIRDLVESGTILVGPRPQGSPGLAFRDSAVDALATELWGDLDGSSKTSRSFGQGRVYWGLPLAQVLDKEGLGPDYRFRGEGAAAIVATHRHLDGGELYFIANQADAPARIEADLRVSNREPELWHPEDGRIEPWPYQQQPGRTTLLLKLDPYQSVFVVFRKPTVLRARELPAAVVTPLAIYGGGWDLAFPPGCGAPAALHLPQLGSWTELGDPGARYFSGTAVYTKNVDAELDWFKPGQRLLLDMGEVHEVARVTINGIDAGTAWMPPYRLDVTQTLQPGHNQLRIEVANLWPNRIIGDLQAGAAKKYAYSTFDLYMPDLVKLPYTPDTPLLPSGLLGPVQVLAETH